MSRLLNDRALVLAVALLGALPPPPATAAESQDLRGGVSLLGGAAIMGVHQFGLVAFGGPISLEVSHTRGPGLVEDVELWSYGVRAGISLEGSVRLLDQIPLSGRATAWAGARLIGVRIYGEAAGPAAGLSFEFTAWATPQFGATVRLLGGYTNIADDMPPGFGLEFAAQLGLTFVLPQGG